MSNDSNKRKKIGLCLLVSLWGAGVVAAVATLGNYEFTAGEQLALIKQWPEKLAIPFNDTKQNLIVAVHPHCACSKAGLSELRKALATAPGAAEIHLVFYQPAGADVKWHETELVAKSAELPAARIWFDIDGKIAASLGARTSFDVFLFNSKREVLFRGGITRGRGIHGDNSGRAALEAYLQGGTAKAGHPVYGCPLQKNPKNSLKEV